MQVQTAKTRRIKDRFRQDQSIGDDNSDIGIEASKALGFLGTLQALGREDLKTVPRGGGMDGGRREFEAAAAFKMRSRFSREI
jgi:hypothetical protein